MIRGINVYRPPIAAVTGRAVAAARERLARGQVNQGSARGAVTGAATIVGLSGRTDQSIVVTAGTLGTTGGDDRGV